jgi:hypothetical protein
MDTVAVAVFHGGTENTAHVPHRKNGAKFNHERCNVNVDTKTTGA